MKKHIMLMSLLLTLALASSALAQDDGFIIVPVGVSKANVVTVAASGADFTNPAEAVNSITDASAGNPYTVTIAAGSYDIGEQQIVMKPYVNIIGAGIDITTVTSSIGTAIHMTVPGNFQSYAALVGADNTSLADLTIVNDNPANGVVVFTGAVSMTLRNVRMERDGGVESFGLYASGSTLFLEDCEMNVTISSSGNYNGAYGLYVEEASTVASHNLVVSTVSNNDMGQGVHVREDSVYTSEGGAVTVSAADDAFGYLVHQSTLSITDQLVSVDCTDDLADRSWGCIFSPISFPG